MKGISFVTPVIEHDLNCFIDNIPLVLENLSVSNFNIVEWIVVVQHKTEISADVLNALKKFDINVLFTNFYSISRARNIGIREIRCSEENTEVVCFLDADALPSVELLNFFSANINEGIPLVGGKIFWGGAEDIKLLNITRWCVNKNFSVPSPLVIFNTFLGCYAFNKKLLLHSSVLFDETIGPAENTKLKTGEDVMFLLTFVNSLNLKKILYSPISKVFHPARESDNEKALVYAEGQAITYSNILKGSQIAIRFRLASFVYLFLFVINGFVKVFLRKKNSILILRARLNALAKGIRK